MRVYTDRKYSVENDIVNLKSQVEQNQKLQLQNAQRLDSIWKSLQASLRLNKSQKDVATVTSEQQFPLQQDIAKTFSPYQNLSTMKQELENVRNKQLENDIQAQQIQQNTTQNDTQQNNSELNNTISLNNKQNSEQNNQQTAINEKDLNPQKKEIKIPGFYQDRPMPNQSLEPDIQNTVETFQDMKQYNVIQKYVGDISTSFRRQYNILVSYMMTKQISLGGLGMALTYFNIAQGAVVASALGFSFYFIKMLQKALNQAYGSIVNQYKKVKGKFQETTKQWTDKVSTSQNRKPKPTPNQQFVQQGPKGNSNRPQPRPQQAPINNTNGSTSQFSGQQQSRFAEQDLRQYRQAAFNQRQQVQNKLQNIGNPTSAGNNQGFNGSNRPNQYVPNSQFSSVFPQEMKGSNNGNQKMTNNNNFQNNGYSQVTYEPQNKEIRINNELLNKKDQPLFGLMNYNQQVKQPVQDNRRQNQFTKQQLEQNIKESRNDMWRKSD